MQSHLRELIIDGKMYLKQGYIIGNNINIDYERDFDDDEEEEKEKFAGAFNITDAVKVL